MNARQVLGLAMLVAFVCFVIKSGIEYPILLVVINWAAAGIVSGVFIAVAFWLIFGSRK